ncbi:hypothetical protein FISHEDRAFT_54767 [Fistulina hepatica ATCC 64428]|uniref:Essential protein Yae1 N-terminal domain-containing protein n=1 Tax=Fistulina hepatica ATCC 64428 TaxID=1128425 RepID=A0A0D7AQE6_9AGAR|nr:hypothetical protein FISHEDRAFT_54767 [Fistulina hepatica ATCC 64428]
MAAISASAALIILKEARTTESTLNNVDRRSTSIEAVLSAGSTELMWHVATTYPIVDEVRILANSPSALDSILGDPNVRIKLSRQKHGKKHTTRFASSHLHTAPRSEASHSHPSESTSESSDTLMSRAFVDGELQNNQLKAALHDTATRLEIEFDRVDMAVARAERAEARARELELRAIVAENAQRQCEDEIDRLTRELRMRDVQLEELRDEVRRCRESVLEACRKTRTAEDEAEAARAAARAAETTVRQYEMRDQEDVVVQRAALQKWYKAGKKQGYEDGYDDGHRKGEARGLRDGRKLGWKEGEARGYDLGKKEGLRLGIARGQAEERSNAFDVYSRYAAEQQRISQEQEQHVAEHRRHVIPSVAPQPVAVQQQYVPAPQPLTTDVQDDPDVEIQYLDEEGEPYEPGDDPYEYEGYETDRARKERTRNWAQTSFPSPQYRSTPREDTTHGAMTPATTSSWQLLTPDPHAHLLLPSE